LGTQSSRGPQLEGKKKGGIAHGLRGEKRELGLNLKMIEWAVKKSQGFKMTPGRLWSVELEKNIGGKQGRRRRSATLARKEWGPPRAWKRGARSGKTAL